ncbi:type VI secretion system protein TssL [Meridianimarinicoccus roseus]|uniref:Type VI secretion system protein TssL n=1 Tax=Meridianimarinicoccus roseus TaxID=2072018 RepID=A0A2V2LBS3_9RHOB|nr:type IVB secretion system protein IcmH/DotU [Meridianimarinicoccus roseus]PWR01181.1 type VI secretion system protein TssL [Meridianimarinicoccus roseus]
MSDEDPFAEPEDGEKTVIRPNPGGRRPGVATPASLPVGPGVAPRAVAAAPAPSGGSAQTAGIAGAGGGVAEAAIVGGMTGMNPLNAAAATLFALVSRIRNRAQHPDPDALRRSVVGEIRAFESRAMQARIDERSVKVARYAICATLDDVVLNTPWGEASSWSTQSMVGTFHRETVGGDRFYDLLARLEQDPATNIDLLEFLFMCLSLGFEGRLRVEQGGRDRHAQVRAGLAGIIRAQRGAVEADLSPHWQGVERPHKPLSAWRPVWLAVSIAAVLLGSGFVGLSYALSSNTADLTDRLAALDRPGAVELERRAPPVVPVPTVDEEAQLKQVAGFLNVEINDGIVKVFQNANTITVRLTGAGMFGSGSAVLQTAFETPLSRVADALNETGGPVIVAGHSDNVPIRSAKFPNNLALSLARAESVKSFLAGKLDDPSRLKAEGRADKEPVMSNDTAEGRAANRRIEIVLVRKDVQ